MPDTLVYTVCDASYCDFIPLFIYSNLFFDTVDIEVGLYAASNPASYKSINDAIQFCTAEFPDRTIHLDYIHPNQCAAYRKYTSRLFVNSLRFLIEPTVKRDYCYISDIDIICCTPHFTTILKNDLTANNRRYSNICRYPHAEHKQLSGLHFTEWGAYYPLDYSSIPRAHHSDEHMLFSIVSARGPIDYTTTFRPVFGPHVSPNRTPEAVGTRPGWGYSPFKAEFEKLIMSNGFEHLFPLFSERVQRTIITLCRLYHNQA